MRGWRRVALPADSVHVTKYMTAAKSIAITMTVAVFTTVTFTAQVESWHGVALLAALLCLLLLAVTPLL